MKIIMILLLAFCLFKWFRYYCLSRGLLYYLGTKYIDMPDQDKMKELTLKAMNRTINEFFHKK